MKQILILAVLAISAFAHAEVGFKHGNELTAQLIEGDIYVQCNGGGGPGGGGPTSGSYTCREDILNPGETDYFQGPAGVDADYLILTATHADGSKRTKDDNYVGAKAQSESRFNLWIATLLQRPLLDGGKNDIKYTLKSKGKVVSEGNFTANVHDGGSKYCNRRGYYYSSDSHDCSFPDRFCDQYFQENNYCQ